MVEGAEVCFAELLKHYRAVAGLTQEGLAERANLSARAISDLERGVKRYPYLHTVGRLVHALGLDEGEAAHFRTAARRPSRTKGELGTAEPARTGLPSQPTPFIGRQREIEEVKTLLSREEVRLLTLTGPGGVGKTRLALRVAEEVANGFPDGIIFISLASLIDPELVPGTLAAVLGVKEAGGEPILDRLTVHLREKRSLLVLDNFEHLLPAAMVVSYLIAACPDLRVIVTSRAVLRLAAEFEYPVPPLVTPVPGHLPGLVGLSQYDAIQLFVQRARAVKPRFELTEENAPMVAEICVRLDGLPLAMELAAARIRLLPPLALLSRLADRLALLTGGPRDVPARQQTLRDTIDWSYFLLSEQEQVLFARLSVFSGSASFAAVEEVCTKEGDRDLVGELASLVEQSLVQQQGEEEPRFQMLATIREYASERLRERGDEEEARDRHAGYFLALAQDAEWRRDAEDAAGALRLLEADHDNLRAALAWCAAEPCRGETALRLAASLGWFWQQGEHWNEGHRWLEDALALPAAANSPQGRAMVLSALAELEIWRANHSAGRARAEEGVALWRSLQDRRGLAGAVHNLAIIRAQDADHDGARELLAEATELWRSVGNARRLSSTLVRLGTSEICQGRLAAGRDRLEESLEADRALVSGLDLAQRLRTLAHVAYRQGDAPAVQHYLAEAIATAHSIDAPQDAQIAQCAVGWTAGACGEYELAWGLLEGALVLARQTGQTEMGNAGISWLLNHLGDAARGLGDDGQATTLYQESLALFEQAGHVQGRATSFHNLGHLALTRGDLRLASDLFAESLRGFFSIGFRWCSADALTGLAGVASHKGLPERAATLFGAAAAIHRSIDVSGVFVQRVNEASCERDTALARDQVDRARWNPAWEVGQAMSLEDAIACALVKHS